MNDSEKFSPALEGLRGVAILWVIPHNADAFPASHDWLSPLAVIAHSGWIGVQLFFVLSGFLITGKLLDSRGSSNYYGAFFGRRVLRIFPLYFLTLAFFLLVLPRLLVLPPAIVESYHMQPWYWFFANNWVQPTQGAVYWFPHFWSLAVEEQFYLIWPFVIAFAPFKRLPALCLALIGVAVLARCVLFATNSNHEMTYMFTVCRMDALAAGSLAAVLARSRSMQQSLRSRAPRLLAAIFVSFIAAGLASHLYARTDGVTITVGFTILAAALAIIVYASGVELLDPTSQRLRALLSAKWLRSVGRYSFAMYVFHMPLMLIIEPHVLPWLKTLGPSYPLTYPLVIGAVSYAAAFISFHLVEKHFLRLKSYLVPGSAWRAVAAPGVGPGI